MPQLVVDDVPREIYERLEKRAAAGRRSVRDETLLLLERVLCDVSEESLNLLGNIRNITIPARMALPSISQCVPSPRGSS